MYDPKAAALAENQRILTDPKFRDEWMASGNAQYRMDARKAHADLYGYDFNEVNNPINKFFGGGSNPKAANPGGGGPAPTAAALPPDDNGPTPPTSGIVGGIHPRLSSGQFGAVGSASYNPMRTGSATYNPMGQTSGFMRNVGNAISSFGRMSNGRTW